MGYKTDEEPFRKLISELERLSCLKPNEGQSKHGLCTALWSAVEGCPLSFQLMTISGVENDYATSVERTADSIRNF